MTGNPVGWFGIHARDMARARAFYENVFGQPLQEVAGGRFLSVRRRLATLRRERHDLARRGRGCRGLRRLHAVFQLRRLRGGGAKGGGLRRQTVAGKIPHRQRLRGLCRRQRGQPHRPAFAAVIFV